MTDIINKFTFFLFIYYFVKLKITKYKNNLEFKMVDRCYVQLINH